MNTENETPPIAPPKKLSIKIIGVGGAGGNAIQHMMQGDLRELSFVTIHTNARVLAHSTIPDKLLLGLKLMRGLGTGGDPDLGKAAAEEDVAKLKTVCAGADLVFILAGLGGGTATGVVPVLARAAKETGALVLAVVTLPFEFEGARRHRQAAAGLQQLKAAADGVICLPHQKVAKLIDEKTSLLEAFNITNELLAQGVRGIWQMLTRQGLINVDFADLCSVLRGRHSESSFAAAQAQGEGRAREVVEKLLANPLLDAGQTLAGADAILVSLVGGPDLAMSEVTRVMEQINRQAENAHLIIGAAIADDFQGRLAVTLVASRRGPSPQELADQEAAEGVTAPRGILAPEIENQFFGAAATRRPASRFVAPPPELTQEKANELLAQQTGSSWRLRKSAGRWRQGQLALDIISKGRFEKSEPTIYHGEDLDVPTYIRRGVALN
jgi:cell division protein FtsZ